MHGKKIINNSLISIIYRITILLIGFVTRKVFIVYLGEEILGLNSLYGNLLDLLNLADLGIGVAVQYQLYEPLVKKDIEKLSKIISAAKRIYNFIGLFVFVSGFLLSFGIQFLIKESAYPLWFIRLSFLISVMGTASSYFFVERKLFLQANEEVGIVNIADLCAKVLIVIVSLFFTIQFKNYFIYLSVNVLYGLLSNLFTYYVFRKKYPEIKSDANDIQIEMGSLLSNLKNVIPMKLSNYVYNSTDNIIISKVLGLTLVAVYSNYMTIINGIMSVEYLIGNVLTASLGKIVKEAEYGAEKVYHTYLLYQYIQFLFTGFCTIILWNVCNPFITIWLGEKFTLDKTAFVLLVIEFYIHSMYQPAYVMYGSTGKFAEDRVVTFFSALINIIISIILVVQIGLAGVIIGTIVTDIYIWVVRSYQIVRSYFGEHFLKYAIKMLVYTLGVVAGCILSDWISTKIIVGYLMFEIIIKGIICVIISLFVMLTISARSKEFKMMMNYIKGSLLYRKE